jgi:cytosine/adenosine deaminase-related metal-dependent hydrolase
MRDTLRSHRAHTGTTHPAGSIPAATIDSARAIGLGDVVGVVAAGKRADLVLLEVVTCRASPRSAGVGGRQTVW